MTKPNEKPKSRRRVSKKPGEDLNLNQKRFCVLYASDKEFFGNGVMSYMEAYQTPKTKRGYATAKANAFKLLTNAHILRYMNHLFETRGLNDAFVDKQLEFIITQNADIRAKVGGIKEYNQLKQRIKNKIELSGKVTIAKILNELENPDKNPGA